jgi:LysR family hydrogen peroxide-inducible transcriptional activator
MIGTTARWLAPQLMELTADRHPNLALMIAEGITTGLESQLADGQLDLAVLNFPVHGKDLLSKLLFEEDLVLVVPADHPLAALDRQLVLDDLAELKLILPLPGTALRDELDAALKPSGIELSASAQIDGLRLIATLTFEGYGPAILPATAIPTYLRTRFRALTVQGLPRRRVGVAQRSRGLPTAPTLALLELLQTIVATADLPSGLHPGAATVPKA